MKTNHFFWLAGLVLAFSIGWARPEPVAVLTVRSYADLQDTASRLVKTVNPNDPTDVPGMMAGVIGLQDLSTLDLKRPWQVAVWYESTQAPPLLALKVPVKDIAKFKESLRPDSMLRMAGQGWKQLKGDFGLISLAPEAALSEAQKADFQKWENQALTKPRAAVQLTTRLGDPLRKQLLGMVALGKMAMTQSFATNKAFAATGVSSKAMSDMFGVYFGMAETFLSGLEEWSLELDLTKDALRLQKTIVPIKDSPLAGWMARPNHSLGKKLTGLLDPKASFSFVGHFDNNPAKMELMNQFILAGMQFQNMDPEDPAMKEMQKLLENIVPMSFAGSLYMDKGMDFTGAYEFPEAKVQTVYGEVKKFINNGLQGMVGPEKMYTSAGLQEKKRVLDGVSIDRFTVVINTNSPMLKMPGQKEQIMAMWPDGKMEFDYAVKGGQLLFASPRRMEALLKQEAASPRRLAGKSPGPNTLLAGHMNFLQLMKQSMEANPMLPPDVKKQFAKLNSEGTEVELIVNMNKRMQANLHLPLKLLAEFGRMAQREKTAGAGSAR